MLRAQEGIPAGHLTWQEVRILQEVGRDAERGLEIGSLLGRSSVALGAGMRGPLYCVDPWPDDKTYQKFRKNIEPYKHHILPLRMTSDEYAHMIEGARLEGTFDFVFIDGDHSEEQVRRDILLAKRLVHSAGRILGHDYKPGRWDGVVRAVDDLIDDPTFVKGTMLWMT